MKDEDKTKQQLIDELEELRNEALREAEEKYKLIFENAQEGINIYEEFPDGSRKLVECNPRYIEMSGYSEEEFMQIGNPLKIQEKKITSQEDAVNKEKSLTGQPYIVAFIHGYVPMEKRITSSTLPYLSILETRNLQLELTMILQNASRRRRN